MVEAVMDKIIANNMWCNREVASIRDIDDVLDVSRDKALMVELIMVSQEEFKYNRDEVIGMMNEIYTTHVRKQVA